MNKLYDDTAVQAIANAIRAKNGSSDTYTIAEMSTALNDISYYAKPTISNVSLATFEADGLPLNSLKVSVEAKQDLHGYDKPWVGGAGKNKIDASDATTSDAGYFINKVIDRLPSGDYVLSFDCIVSENALCQFDVKDAVTVVGTKTVSINSGTSRVTMNFTASSSFNVAVAYINKASTIQNIQLEKGSTVTSFEPYSNICPISGWDAVVVSDVDDVDNPTVTQATTITLPQTVYGGEVDVVNGTSGNKLTHDVVVYDGSEDWVLLSSGAKRFYYNALPEDMTPDSAKKAQSISNTLTYRDDSQTYGSYFVFGGAGIYCNKLNAEETLEEFKARLSTTNLQICYPLATPTTLTTYPTPIKSLNGLNNLSVDSGDVLELEYFKEV